MFINLSEINNDLTICYSLKLELVDFYSKSTIDNAKVNPEHLICSCIDTNIEKGIIKSANHPLTTGLALLPNPE